MAHKKGQGSSRNGRDSNPQMLGIKLFGGQFAKPGSILCRQHGTNWQPGQECRGRPRLDHLLADRGYVTFDQRGGGVIPMDSHAAEVPESDPRDMFVDRVAIFRARRGRGQRLPELPPGEVRPAGRTQRRRRRQRRQHDPSRLGKAYQPRPPVAPAPLEGEPRRARRRDPTASGGAAKTWSSTSRRGPLFATATEIMCCET